MYIPGRGDVVWITLDPQVGHVQAGRRPALVLSSSRYNSRVGLAIVCPITSQSKGYPFEVVIPPDLEVNGVILADQIKSVDWQGRAPEFLCTLPQSTIEEALGKLYSLL